MAADYSLIEPNLLLNPVKSQPLAKNMSHFSYRYACCRKKYYRSAVGEGLSGDFLDTDH